jgi:hypothetical protein
MKKPEEVMEILEAYDLAGSFRAAADLVGCDHKTVAYWVRMRERAGGMPAVERQRPAMEVVFAEKIDELVDRSSGKIRADVAHDRRRQWIWTPIWRRRLTASATTTFWPSSARSPPGQWSRSG